MQRSLILIVGVIVGAGSVSIWHYYLDSQLKFGYQFLLGVLSATSVFAVLLILVLIIFYNARNSINDKENNEILEKIISASVPAIENSQINKVKATIHSIAWLRGLYLSGRLFMSLIIVVGGTVGTFVLIKQNDLIDTQNSKLESQNDLFEVQNELVKKQSEYLNSQTELFNNQNDLISTQNDHIDRQNSFSQREYYDELIANYSNQLSNNDFSNKTKLNAFNRLYTILNKSGTNSELITVDVNQTAFNDVKLRDKKFKNYTFKSCTFYESEIINVTFSDCTFDYSKFSDAKFYNVKFDKSIFNKVSFSLANNTKSQEYALKQMTKYLRYNDFENKFKKRVSFYKSKFKECDFRYTDLRDVNGINSRTFDPLDIESGLFFGAIINDDDIEDPKIKALMRDHGVIFNKSDLESFMKKLNDFSLSDEERLGVRKMTNYYAKIVF